ncbi:MAG TPA: hypothetical protein DCZ94_15110 [Lentisphaeria bacterium]|nr:MAG: hypothetical protein A2X48_03260 [Lentisphaerae bacterium GWF2_49_21]HBC88279.1 hypothetical protein [Lentisphaeria bacterium]
MHNRLIAEQHRKWWKRETPEILISNYFPVKMPYGGLDIDIPPSLMAMRKKANAEAIAAAGVPSDTLNVQAVNFGPALLPALAGAGFEYDASTSWSVHAFDSANLAKVNTFDPNHPLWRKYIQRLEPLLENWSWDTYLPSLADYLGPLDIVAGLIGSEKLAMELYDNPEDVKRLAMDAAKLLSEAINFELDLHRKAGLADGVTDVFSIWLPGRGVRLSEDFSTLVGPDQFQEFFLEPDSYVCENFDSVFMHVHSGAIQCLPGFVDVRKMGAIEFGNDPNGPGIDDRIEAGKLVQKKGLPLQMTSWNIKLKEEEVLKIIKSLDPRGLLVRFQMDSIEEARELYKLIKEI